MNLRQEIEHLTPALRRLAHGLAATVPKPASGGCDELVQETLLRAMRFEKPVKGISVQHWLYAILVGVIRQHNRSQEARQASGARTARAFAWQSGNETRPTTVRAGHGNRPAADSQSCNNIQRDLQALALEEREVLALVVLEGLNYTSAAAILGLPRPTLIARLARARASLSKPDASNMPANAQTAGHLRLIN